MPFPIIFIAIGALAAAMGTKKAAKVYTNGTEEKISREIDRTKLHIENVTREISAIRRRDIESKLSKVTLIRACANRVYVKTSNAPKKLPEEIYRLISNISKAVEDYKSPSFNPVSQTDLDNVRHAMRLVHFSQNSLPSVYGYLAIPMAFLASAIETYDGIGSAFNASKEKEKIYAKCIAARTSIDKLKTTFLDEKSIRDAKWDKTIVPLISAALASPPDAAATAIIIEIANYLEHSAKSEIGNLNGA